MTWNSQESATILAMRSGDWSWWVQALGTPGAQQAGSRDLYLHRNGFGSVMRRPIQASLSELSDEQAKQFSRSPAERWLTVREDEVSILAHPRPPAGTLMGLVSDHIIRPEKLRLKKANRPPLYVDYNFDVPLGDLTDEELANVIVESGLLDNG